MSNIVKVRFSEALDPASRINAYGQISIIDQPEYFKLIGFLADQKIWFTFLECDSNYTYRHLLRELPEVAILYPFEANRQQEILFTLERFSNLSDLAAHEIFTKGFHFKEQRPIVIFGLTKSQGNSL